MKKIQTTYSCENCGAQYAKWQGRCTSCQVWNTIIEAIPAHTASWHVTGLQRVHTSSRPKQLQDIGYETKKRIPCPDREFSRVLGGGIVPGSLVLLGGEPGIGKSTLLLQIVLSLQAGKILYVAGEESEAQIKMRAERIACQSESCYILNETSLSNIFRQLAQLQPVLLIIDSIQTLHIDSVESVPGSIAQLSACTAALMHYAKSTSTSIFLVGHITKEGNLAGPKVLEHMVDTVLQFEGDRHLNYRIVRTIKNRFGATAELGLYEMKNNGLREVTNPAELLISQCTHNLSGIAIGAALEGNRALLIELQALVNPAVYGTAQRNTTGFNVKRLNMLLAVLEKKADLRLSTQDIFLNIAGGLSVVDPALDLAVCMATTSALKEVALPPQSCFAAEVGLGGELRGVNRIEQRITEAAKLGFNTLFMAKYNLKGLAAKELPIKVKPIASIEEIISYLF